MARKLLISEIYGPVVQGEGALIGQPTVFVRAGGCDYRCRWCLGAFTRISMFSGGPKRIRDVRVGDELVGYDERAGELNKTTVTAIASRVADQEELVVVEASGRNNGGTVCSKDHLFRTVDRGWVPAERLVPGDVLFSTADFDISSWKMRHNNPMKRPAVAAQVSATLKRIWTPEKRDRQRQVQMGIEGHRTKMLGDKNPMKDPEVRHRQIQSRSDWSPSKPELRVQRICQEEGLPFEICNMRVRVGDRYPDFVAGNGVRKLIEVYDPSFQGGGEPGKRGSWYPQAVQDRYRDTGWEALSLAVAPGVTDRELTGKITRFALNGAVVRDVRPLSNKAIGALRGDLSVWDIKCEPFPTFFAGKLLTHNCDSLYAVLPKHKSTWGKMDAEYILNRIQELTGDRPIWVTLSGGNPALQDFSELVVLGHSRHGHKFAIETQGTKSPIWMRYCDHVVLSPKPPSSGMDTDLMEFEECAKLAGRGASVKIVIFDRADFEWARGVRELVKSWHRGIPVYLQVGNNAVDDPDVPPHYRMTPDVHPAGQILTGTRCLQDLVLEAGWFDVRVLPQLHVLIHGNDRGV